MAEVTERARVARSDGASVLGRIGTPAVGLAIWRRPVPQAVRGIVGALAADGIRLRCVLTRSFGRAGRSRPTSCSIT